MYFTSDSTWNQGQIFISLVFIGMVLGLVFVIFSAAKPNVGKKYLAIVQDIMFCLITFVVVGFALYVLDNGKVYLYMWFGIFVGFIASIYIFKSPVKTITNKANKLINFIKERLIIHKK